MADRPKAHRRLVPRVPKKPKEPAAPKLRADSEITVQRPALPESLELMDRTEIRTNASSAPSGPRAPSAAQEDLDVTVRRTAAPPAPEDVIVDSFDFDENDSGETVALQSNPLLHRPSRPSRPAIEQPPSRPSPSVIDRASSRPSPSVIVRAPPRPSPPSIERPAARPTPPPPAERAPSRPTTPPRESFVLGASEPDPPPRFAAASQREIAPVEPVEPAGLPFGLDAASARFIPAGSQLDAAMHVDPDPDAFSDLEPTALKSSPTFAEDRPTTHISPAERGLLAAMAEGHEASRLVYMNWLERRGEKQRAEFLRLDHALATMDPRDIRHADAASRLRALAQNISVDWRSRVARSRIEGCGDATGSCPGFWRALPAESDDVRTCGVCNHQVFYCVSIDLARSRVHAGQRVAIDIAAERAPDDLLQQCTRCRSAVPQGNRFCPHCGHALTGYSG